MSDWIADELKHLEMKHPAYRGFTHNEDGVFKLRYFWPPLKMEAGMNANAIQFMESENSAVRELDGVSEHIVSAFTKILWPEGETSGARVLGKLFEKHFEENPTRGSFRSVGNCFAEVRMMIHRMNPSETPTPCDLAAIYANKPLEINLDDIRKKFGIVDSNRTWKRKSRVRRAAGINLPEIGI